MSYRLGFEGLTLIGYQLSSASHQLKDFLAGNLFPYRWVNVETDPEAEKLLQLYELTKADLPAVLTGDGMALKRPTIAELGEKVGLSPKASQRGLRFGPLCRLQKGLETGSGAVFTRNV